MRQPSVLKGRFLNFDQSRYAESYGENHEYTRKVETGMKSIVDISYFALALISRAHLMENEISKCRSLAERRKKAFRSLGKTKPKRRAIWLTVITWRG